MSETSKRGETTIFRSPPAIKRALQEEADRRGTNATVLLNEILAERYGIEYVPSEQSARRKTPFGGGRPRAA